MLRSFAAPVLGLLSAHSLQAAMSSCACAGPALQRVEDTVAYHVTSVKFPQPAVLVTAEHASNVMPPGWEWKGADLRIKDMHWGYDIGSEIFANEFQEAYSVNGVYSKVSRILVDMNRPRDSPTLIRTHCDNIPIEINASISKEDLARRMALYDAYHARVGALVSAGAQSGLKLILSCHSFTPLYEGQPRSLEVGAITDNESDPLAQKITDALNAEGIKTAVNEPWSGLEGFMHSASHHSRTNGIRSIMLELRQDLILDAAWRARVMKVTHRVLAAENIGFV